MKRLFVVSHNKPGTVKAAGVDCPFPNKMEAKAARDSVGGIEAGFFCS